MKTVLKFIKPYKKQFFLFAFLLTVETFASLFMPYIMSIIVDDGIRLKRSEIIVSYAVVMAVLSVLLVATRIISVKIVNSAQSSLISDIFRALFKKVNSLSFEQYSRIGSSGLLTRSTDDVFNLDGAVQQMVYVIVTVPIMLIGGGILSFISDPLLSLVFVCSIPPIFVFLYFVVKPLSDMWDRTDKYIDEQNRIVRERLSGIRVVRAFNNDAREHQRAKHATEEMSKYMIRSNIRSGFVDPVATLLLNIGTVVMIWIGGMRAEAGILENAGAVIAVVQYVGLIANAVLTLSWTIAWLPKMKVSSRRIGEILDLQGEDAGAESDISFASDASAEIELAGVTFSYPDSSTKVLDSVSFKIERGQTVAIIGGTGSGKTTLVRLLLGFYECDFGDIRINGTSYSSLSKKSIRSAYSAALQRGMIFEGRLIDNINMGNRDASLELVETAISDCALSEFVSSHKEGLDYGLVGMGQNVSGGQKQRINMARTVIREAPVYIFDDCFSALDYLTESKIKKALFERLCSASKLIVTQRVSTALSAEKILVMDRGRIVGEGSHGELIRSSDIYREICLSQLGADALAGYARGGRDEE